MLCRRATSELAQDAVPNAGGAAVTRHTKSLSSKEFAAISEGSTVSRRPVQHPLCRPISWPVALLGHLSIELNAMFHAQGDTSSMSGATSGIASDEVSIPTAVEK